MQAVRAAAIATEKVRRTQVMSPMAAITKADASPVTVADFAAQAVVVTILRQVLGECPMLGEESDSVLRESANAATLALVVAAAGTAVPGITEAAVLDALSAPQADPTREACWTLDPVDGTKGFLRGGQYAICLGWIEGGRPTVAVMAAPRLAIDLEDPAHASESGVLACAVRGSGARWLSLRVREVSHSIGGSLGMGIGTGDDEDGGERLLTRAWRHGEGVRLALSFEKAHGDASTAERIAAKCGPLLDPLRLDSAAKYILVAHGRANAYLRVPHGDRRENVWDHAAGVLIAEESGCVTCDLDGKPLDFAQGATLEANRGIVVAPPALAAELVRAARS